LNIFLRDDNFHLILLLHGNDVSMLSHCSGIRIDRVFELFMPLALTSAAAAAHGNGKGEGPLTVN
jgi:hypothetical protein